MSSSSDNPQERVADPSAYVSWLTTRFGDAVDLDALIRARVAVLGLDSLGDWIASSLARMGLGGLTLAGAGCVEVPDVAETNRTLPELGKPKLKAAAKHLLAINPLLRLTQVDGDVNQASDQELALLASSHDLVINTLGDTALRARLNVSAYPKTATIHARILSGSALGEVVWTRPGETRCLLCSVPTNRSFQGDPDETAPKGIGDVPLTVWVVVQAALGLLLQRRPAERGFERFLNPRRNLLLVGGHRQGSLFDYLPPEVIAAVMTVDTMSARPPCELCASSGQET